jgi:hypothetical protein
MQSLARQIVFVLQGLLLEFYRIKLWDTLTLELLEQVAVAQIKIKYLRRGIWSENP